MVEELGEFYQGHFCIRAGHAHHTAAEGLTEGVGAKIVNSYLIPRLDMLQLAIHHLTGEDGPVFADKTRL